MRAKRIKGFRGFYKIREDGTVWSCKVQGSGAYSGYWKQLKPVSSTQGRLFVTLSHKGKAKPYYIHRLVLEAFVGPCPPGMECRHYPDQDPTNNNLWNLSWANRSVNSQDKILNGTDSRGERNPSVKLTDKQIRRIRRKYATGLYSQSKLGKEYGVSQSAIGSAIRRKNWRHIA